MLTSFQPASPFARRGFEVAGPEPSPPADPWASLMPVAVVLRAGRDEHILAQGAPAGYCYQVESGCARTVRLMEDGRRLIGEFLFAGDLFGWEALDDHDFGVEAVTPLIIRRYPRRDLEALCDESISFRRRLDQLAAAKLRSSWQRLIVLGRKSALERIAGFLLEMADRTTGDGAELPMTRGDIADYLGLTIETVCRGLTQLRQSGIVTIDRARIAIRDRRALGVASCGTLH